jgi:hypothetical protein
MRPYRIAISWEQCKDPRLYCAGRSDVGELVYSDYDMRWAYLPPAFLGHTTIMTSYLKRTKRSKTILQFRACELLSDGNGSLDSVSALSYSPKHSISFFPCDSSPSQTSQTSQTCPLPSPSPSPSSRNATPCGCLIIILLELSLTTLPKWMKEQGYRRVLEYCTAVRHNSLGQLEETVFTAYGRIVPENEVISLGNFPRSYSPHMYCVLLLPTRHSSNRYIHYLRGQIQLDEQQKMKEANESWSNGGSGMTLFYSDDERFSIGLFRMRVFSSDLSLSSAASKTSFEVYNIYTYIVYIVVRHLIVSFFDHILCIMHSIR